MKKRSIKKHLRFFIDPDKATNDIIARLIDQGIDISWHEGKLCSDGKKRNLYGVPKDVLDRIDVIRKPDALSYGVFQQLGNGAIRSVRKVSGKTLKKKSASFVAKSAPIPVLPLTRPPQECLDTDNGEPPPF